MAGNILPRFDEWMPGAPPLPVVDYAPALNTLPLLKREEDRRLDINASRLAGVMAKMREEGLESIESQTD